MRFLFNFFLMTAIALGIGFGLSYYALTDGRLFGAYELGPWVAWPEVGTPNPDPYTLAYAARSGALQLGRGEGMQFVATTDSNGQPLNRGCRYRIEGHTPVGTFWTLTATAPDGTNIAASNDLAAMHSRRLARNRDGSFVINVGKTLMPGNWLEISGLGPFRLVLSLYDTTIFTGVGAEFDALPAIVGESCLP